MELLERDGEAGAIEDVLAATRAGAGGLLVVEGPAGIGKSALVALARRLGRREEMEVLYARGTELEHDVHLGVARQLFERRLAAADEEEREWLLAGAAALARP